MTASSAKFLSQSRTRKNFVAFAFSILAVAVVARYFYRTWDNRMALDEPFPYRNYRMCDFKDAVYLPARDFLYTHTDPYNWQAFVAAHVTSPGYSPYTPSHLWIAALFAWMNWSAATAAWGALVALSISLMGAVGGNRAIHLIRPDASTAARVTAVAAGVVGVWIWRPSYDATVQGQPTGFYGPVAAILSLTVLAGDSRPRPRGDVATGLWTAVAFCKPQLGLQVLLAESVARRWRALAIGFAVSAVLSVLAVARLAGGVSQVPSWLIHLPGHVSSAPSRLDPRYGSTWIDVSADLHHVGLDAGALSALGPLLAVAVLGTGLWAILLLRRMQRPWLGALTLTLADLIALPDNRYDELVLYPMLLMAAAEAWRIRRTAGSTVGEILLALVLVAGLVPNQVIMFGKADGVVSSVTLMVAFAIAAGIALTHARARTSDANPIELDGSLPVARIGSDPPPQ